MDHLLKDIRYGVRTLLHQPGFTIAAVLTLAIGIGANTAIFSVVNTVLLRPLPYDQSERLVAIWGNYELMKINRLAAKAAEYQDYAAQTQVFDSVAAYTQEGLNLSADGPEHLKGSSVTPNLFPLLGVQPILGHVFSQDPASSRQVVVSYGFWQRRFGGDALVIGRSISLDDQVYTIVGVMPASFQFPHRDAAGTEPADVWRPLAFEPEQLALRRSPYYLHVIGRLAAGVSLAQAQAQMITLGQHFERDFRGYRGPNGEDGGWRISVAPLRDEIVGNRSRALFVLFVAVSLLLLISCANVANLLLVRATKRQKEMAVRAALGASRWRLARQLFVEALLLASVATLLGLLLAQWGVGLLSALNPDILPRANELSIDLRVLAFAVSTAVLISVGFGLIPFLQVSKVELRSSLNNLVSNRQSRLWQWNSVLVAAEVSLSLILLVGSVLLVKSFFHLRQSNAGIDVSNLTSVEIDLSATRYSEPESIDQFYREIQQEVEALPGVQTATVSTLRPLSGNGVNDPFSIEGKPRDPTQIRSAGWQVVGAKYLNTMGVPLVSGRDISSHDVSVYAPAVAVINETMAKRYWPNDNPIGHRVTLGIPGPDNPWVTIVGVAKDVPHSGLGSSSEPDWYLSKAATVRRRHRFLFVRSVLEPAVLSTQLRSAVAAVDRSQPVTEIKTMTDVVAETTSGRRFNTLLLGLFATTALLLATLGIYSVVSYSIASRTHEMGIRVALGANTSDLTKLVVFKAMLPAIIGAGVGLGVSLAITRWMSGLLFQVKATDPSTYVLVLVLILSAAFIACLLPARRAAKVDPLIALRSE